MSYKVVTWGCQMNVEDSEQMERHLQGLGMSEAGSFEDAEVVLLNTCSVRKKPEDKAFSMLGVLREVKERRPQMVIGVCGCMAQLRPEEIHRRAPHVDFVIGTGEISQIPSLVAETKQARRFRQRVQLPERKGAIVSDIPRRVAGSSPRKLKAFVPIQYGCDKFCAFCIVPTTRGRERSRPTQDILDEVRRLADLGTKEITLLGQTVNSYGKNLLEGKVPFAKLLWMLAEIPGIERIRYTSPYPRDFNDDLIAAHRDCPKVMPHVHLPLQSGDDTVLRAMRRVYTVSSFAAIYNRLREEIPGVAITTDIIVGFPGETTGQFENTLSLVERLRFDSAFMFAYSPRPGTPAAQESQLSTGEKAVRLRSLIALQNSVTCEINAAEAGEVREVLVEGPSEKDPLMLKGLTPHFKTVHFPTGRVCAGSIVPVTLSKPHSWGFTGTVCGQLQSAEGE
jgi:tRNA-2-methylthio-N6-dimethylallyladenosine synthase